MNLLQAAREDAVLRDRLPGILRLAPFGRKSLRSRFLSKMRLKGAPAEFREAPAFLADDAVAGEARRFLDKE